MSLFDHIPLMRPWLDSAELAAVQEVLTSGWLCQGQKVDAFEKAIASMVGAKYAVATNACTSAIHLAIKCCIDIQSGDEILVPDFTCMADVNAVVMAGAVPRLVDIDPCTYNMSIEAAERAIDSHTRGILLVDQIGLPADLDSFKQLATAHNLVLIEDAATALGAKYKNAYLGGHDLPTTFSFHPRKMITTGEGGMLLTNDEGVAGRARIYRSAGASTSDLERHLAKGTSIQQYPEPGYNYRMTDIQAAIGLTQLDKLPFIVAERARQASLYDKALGDKVCVPYVPSYATHCYSSYLVRVTSCVVSKLVNWMADNNISCRYGIQPLHREPWFEGCYLDDDFVCSNSVASDSIFLPIFPGLTTGEQDRIIEVLLGGVAKFA